MTNARAQNIGYIINKKVSNESHQTLKNSQSSDFYRYSDANSIFQKKLDIQDSFPYKSRTYLIPTYLNITRHEFLLYNNKY